MARGINRFQRPLRLQVDFDAHIAERSRREFICAQREKETDQPAVRFKQLRVRETDPFLTVSFNWKDADLEEVALRILQERRIFQSPDNIFVDAACLLGCE